MNHTTDVDDTRQFKAIDGFSDGHILLYGKPVLMKEPDWFVEGAAGRYRLRNDMAKWLMIQLNGGEYGGRRLLNTEGVETMHTAPAGVESTYGMGWTIDGSKIEHNGILWTYYADQLLMPTSGYGIVVLFNSGLKSLVNYTSFTQGISDILNGEQPRESFLNVQTNEIAIGLLTLVTVGIGIRALTRLNKWEAKYRRRSRWGSWLGILSTLIPLALFLSLSKIMTFIGGGRVMNGERIFLMMPSIFIWLMLAGLFSLAIAATRIIKMYKIKKMNPRSDG